METERIALSQQERERLRVLHEVKQKHLTQVAAAEQLKITDRQVRRILLALGVSAAFKAFGSCTAQHFGLTVTTAGTAALGAPVSKAALGLRSGMQGASDTMSLSSAIEWKLFGAAGPKIPGVNILGTSRSFGVIGRGATFVSGALAIVDARLICACMDQRLGYASQGNGNQ